MAEAKGKMISSQSLSTLLLKEMSDKEPECSFFIGSQEYTVDFTSMTQTNVTTRFHREVRRRPAYRSPDSMRPHLQSVSCISCLCFIDIH